MSKQAINIVQIFMIMESSQSATLKNIQVIFYGTLGFKRKDACHLKCAKMLIFNDVYCCLQLILMCNYYAGAIVKDIKTKVWWPNLTSRHLKQAKILRKGKIDASKRQ